MLPVGWKLSKECTLAIKLTCNYINSLSMENIFHATKTPYMDYVRELFLAENLKSILSFSHHYLINNTYSTLFCHSNDSLPENIKTLSNWVLLFFLTQQSKYSWCIRNGSRDSNRQYFFNVCLKTCLPRGAIYSESPHRHFRVLKIDAVC